MSEYILIIKSIIDFFSRFIKPKDKMTYTIPKKTVVFTPLPGPKTAWWHMGSSAGKPSMQVSSRFRVTNITKGNILLVVAKMKKPNILGHVMVQDMNSNYFGSYPIPPGGSTEMSFDFWIIPPIKKEGENFYADIAILDQFNNHHWMKKVEFLYS